MELQAGDFADLLPHTYPHKILAFGVKAGVAVPESPESCAHPEDMGSGPAPSLDWLEAVDCSLFRNFVRQLKSPRWLEVSPGGRTEITGIIR